MIQLFLPQKVPRGGSLEGSYSMSGEDLERLARCRQVEAQLRCIITSTEQDLFLKTGLRGKQMPAASEASFGFPMAMVCNLKSGHGKSPNSKFVFQLPREHPPTYKGKLISVKWLVHVKIDLPLAPDRSSTEEVVVE